MKSGFLIAFAALGLAACAPAGAPKARGVGFDDFSQFELDRARREAALSGQRSSIIPPPQVNTINSPLGGQAIPSSDLAAAGIGQNQRAPLNAGADPNQVLGQGTGLPNSAPVQTNNPGISDEQNFDAVAGRETIESDAQRRAAQAAARQQVQPTAVPQRPSDTGANIVEYALSAPNVKGQEWYSRSILSGASRFQRNCAAYATPDDAQRDFMARGGPEKDRLGIDPDGDGFACGWDPAPFKASFQN